MSRVKKWLLGWRNPTYNDCDGAHLVGTIVTNRFNRIVHPWSQDFGEGNLAVLQSASWMCSMQVNDKELHPIEVRFQIWMLMNYIFIIQPEQENKVTGLFLDIQLSEFYTTLRVQSLSTFLDSFLTHDLFQWCLEPKQLAWRWKK